MGKRYKIWKASINEYRVHDTKTGEVSTHENLFMIDCKLKVDKLKYKQAERVNFKDSGNDMDYFAWIEAEEVGTDLDFLHYTNSLFYNPFKHYKFRNRETLEVVNQANEIVTSGNMLSYW